MVCSSTLMAMVVIHSAKRWKPRRVKAHAKVLSKTCQMDQVSLASVIMRLLCRGQLGFVTTWQVPTRRRCFSIRYARSVVVEFFVETTDYWQAIRRDPDDDKFVDAAVAGNAEWIVTEDSDFDDLVADTRLLVRALNPRDFIDLLRRHGCGE